MMSTHSRYAPSSLARLAVCPASLRLSQDFEGLETEESARGTRLHSETASCIADGMPSESTEAAQCVAWLKSIIQDGDEVRTERRLAYSDFAGKEVYWGTADVTIVRRDGTALVIDWKFGSSFVGAIDNPQIGAYACALYQEELKVGRKLSRIDGYIFQPAAGDVPAVWEDIPLLAEAAYIAEIIASTCKDDPLIKAGDQCRYCPAGQNGACPLCTSQVASLSQALARNVQPLSVACVADASDTTLAAWMDALEMADVFGKAVRTEFMRRLQSAGKGGICGWRRQTAKGALRIKDPCQLLLDMQETAQVTPSAFIECGTFSPRKVADLLKSYASDKEQARHFAAVAEELCEKYGERGAATERIVRSKEV